ncbi:FAD:protein FMN transferase [Reichenbachiella sp. MALMAid0571]|uniref:FAD:protein FMN transferase n=1 Tax=Reichenbachiella sp. MALMAid0571 TaxID=3143939 RepID=UPI0032DF6EA3
MSAENAYIREVHLMGCKMDITVVASDQSEADRYIDMAVGEISRIEKLISSWDSNSQTSLINDNAGIEPVKVDEELFNLIHRAVKISGLTRGAFDISYASMDKIWKYDGSMTKLPDSKLIEQSISKVGYGGIMLNYASHTVFLKLKGMKIGFGAIGKGYAADKAKALLKSKGVKSGIINASGDLYAWGKQPDGSDWKVGITNPLNPKKIFSWLPVDNQAVVTSGDYEKYVMFDGVRYSHIIDPRTGYPSTGVLSTTVFAQSAELADALATSLFVMGVEVGLDFINQIDGLECIIVDKNNKLHTSTNIRLNPIENEN